MKIRIEIEEAIEEDELVLRCSQLNDEIIALQKKIAEAMNSKMQLHVYRQDKEYFLYLDEIIFVETSEQIVAVHTKDQIYETKQRLYELEELLPGNFMRVSKSTIVNTSKIRAIHKNITGASELEFTNTAKKAYASRTLIKSLITKLEEKRLKK